jgi:hypothetical protein
MKNGKIDKREITVRASLASSKVLAYLNASQKKNFNTVITFLKKKNTASAKRTWNSLILSLKDGSIPIDINSLIQYVLRQAYMETNKDLQLYAAKVKHMNEQKKAIRAYLEDLRGMRSGISNGNALNDLNNEIDSIEDELATIGDDASLANIDLQNALQKQQQTLQMMSNVSKTLHDTAMAVIRKIG